ncbi:CLUMA_CG018448, isoform A [Clunio marinus]|uniref:CLUMA_CG018448, isoform A n=1 Tax=Clunio marinus TaxID=568069 RepID=A0A1J1IYL6_9DIPT|nr:CLUMA_CG018448, isoform A [Clunio marinus]
MTHLMDLPKRFQLRTAAVLVSEPQLEQALKLLIKQLTSDQKQNVTTKAQNLIQTILNMQKFKL